MSDQKQNGNALDYLIIGQGIAGSVLAYKLIHAGKSVRVFDQPTADSSSRVAAGIINPVTGRKMVKSWRMDELLPEAEALYRQMEDTLQIHCLHPVNVIKVFGSVKEQNDWLSRKLEDAYAPYLSGVDHPEWAGVPTPHGVGYIQKGYWLDLRQLVDAMGEWLYDEGRLERTGFNCDTLHLAEDGRFRYGDLSAERVIFCEGYGGKDNPFFGELPLQPAKGEILDIMCPGLRQVPGVLNKNGFILPVGRDRYRVGATFRHWDTTPGPTGQGLGELKEKIANITSLPYTIMAHTAAFRPTVKDRRPLLGRHQQHAGIFLLNGLGTKGASLAPWCAAHLIAHMESGAAIDPEVDLRRFLKD